MNDRLKNFWTFLLKVVSPIVVLIVIVIAINQIEPLRDFLIWAWRNLNETGRIMIVSIVGLAMVYFVVVYIERLNRVKKLKEERDQVEERLKTKQKDLDQLEETMIRLAEEGVKENIWRRPDPREVAFVPKDDREVVIISMINLKGGAGKTTLTGNLGATLALMENPLKVLMVDLDFQGTLSSLTVEPSLLDNQLGHEFTTVRLLDSEVSSDLMAKLPVQMHRVAAGKVIVSDESLEQVNFQRQAEFFLDPKIDVRFRFRSFFHRPEIANAFQIVIFDCPPRLTSATVNALTCSDYVLIPTQLDEKSFDAVPRTLDWISKLGHVAQPKILGVVANEVSYWRKDTLIKTHQRGRARLEQKVHDWDPDVYLFSSMICLNNDIASQSERGLAPAADPRSTKVRNLFLDFANELRTRIKK